MTEKKRARIETHTMVGHCPKYGHPIYVPASLIHPRARTREWDGIPPFACGCYLMAEAEIKED